MNIENLFNFSQLTIMVYADNEQDFIELRMGCRMNLGNLSYAFSHIKKIISEKNWTGQNINWIFQSNGETIETLTEIFIGQKDSGIG